MSLLSEDLKMLVARCFLRPPSKGLVYYIACPETFRLKIGYTAGKPEARLRSLQTGSPTRLSLMAVHPGTLDDERSLHFHLLDARVHGEWFSVDERVFEFMAYVCWVAEVDARYRGIETPQWAERGLSVVRDEFGPMPTDILGQMQ